MNENLPVPQKNKFITKLKKMLFVVLSSVGLAGNMTTPVEASEYDTIKVHELDEKNDFKENLKVVSESEQIVNQLIENRKEKGLGEYSQITGEADRVKEQLVALFEGIDKNFDRNAKQKGTQAIDKNDFKKSIINLLENLNDVVFVDDLDGDNEYANYFKDKPSVGAFYRQETNVIALQPEYLTFAGKRISSDMKKYKGQPYIFVHELQHSAQLSGKENASYQENIYTYNSEDDELSLKKVSEDNFFLYSSYLDSLLREGHSNNQAEYVRDFNVDKLDLISETSYSIPTIVYNKLAYLVGEKLMDSYMKNPTTYLCDFLTNQLDSKYGEGSGLEMYSLINNLTLCWNSNYESVKIESIKELEQRYKVAQNKEKSNQKLVDTWKSNHSDSWDRNFEKSLSQANQVNKSYQNTIVDILEGMKDKEENSEMERKNLSNVIEKVCDEQLKKLEKLSLKCIEKDIENISSKKEALEYVQLWDYYRNRCAISKDLSLGLGQAFSDTMKEDNFKLLLKLQHKLYNKCSKFDSLNIKNEDIFNLLIESNLFDVSSARVKQDGNKVTISDQYVINKGEADLGIFVSKENKGNVAKGKKIFNNREKNVKKDYEIR